MYGCSELCRAVFAPQAVQSLCGDGSEPDAPLLCLTYDSLIELVEHLKACQEVASTRTGQSARQRTLLDTQTGRWTGDKRTWFRTDVNRRTNRQTNWMVKTRWTGSGGVLPFLPLL